MKNKVINIYIVNSFNTNSFNTISGNNAIIGNNNKDITQSGIKERLEILQAIQQKILQEIKQIKQKERKK